MAQMADRRQVGAGLSKARPFEIFRKLFSCHRHINAPYPLINSSIYSHVTNTITRLATERVLNLTAKVKLSLSTPWRYTEGVEV
jgi:hypothetical protein